VSDQIPWTAWVTGGLAGSALTLISQWVSRLWVRPRLVVLFKDEEPGCRINTNFIGGTEFVEHYLRLKIKNSGRSTAVGVSVCVTRLTFAAHGVGNQEFAEDVLDLKLTLQLKPILSFLIAPGAHRYVDVAHTNRDKPSHNYDFHVHPARLLMPSALGSHPGTYGAEIFVVAENARPVQRYVTWSWDGGFPGLRIVSNEAVQKYGWRRLLRR
jgi:hypothetical protein